MNDDERQEDAFVPPPLSQIADLPTAAEMDASIARQEAKLTERRAAEQAIRERNIARHRAEQCPYGGVR